MPAGAALAGATLPTLVDQFGWQTAILVAGGAAGRGGRQKGPGTPVRGSSGEPPSGTAAGARPAVPPGKKATVAFPAAAGVFYPFIISPAVAAIAMSGSSVLVAVNALLLKRTRLDSYKPENFAEEAPTPPVTGQASA